MYYSGLWVYTSAPTNNDNIFVAKVHTVFEMMTVIHYIVGIMLFH
jgi:hypothetical protein